MKQVRNLKLTGGPVQISGGPLHVPFSYLIVESTVDGNINIIEKTGGVPIENMQVTLMSIMMKAGQIAESNLNS